MQQQSNDSNWKFILLQREISGEWLLFMYLTLTWCLVLEEGWHLDLLAWKFPLELLCCGLALFPCPTLALSPAFLYCLLPLGCTKSGFGIFPRKSRQSCLLDKWRRQDVTAYIQPNNPGLQMICRTIQQMLLNGTHVVPSLPSSLPHPVFSSQQKCPAPIDSIPHFEFIPKLTISFTCPLQYLTLRSLLMTLWNLRPFQPASRVKWEPLSPPHTTTSAEHLAHVGSQQQSEGRFFSAKQCWEPVVLGGWRRVLWDWVKCCDMSSQDLCWSLPGFLWFWLTDFFSWFLLLKSSSVTKGFNSFWAFLKCQSCISWCLGKGLQDVSSLTCLA